MTEDSRFATLFCAVYNATTRQLTYVNAGHNPPLLFHSVSKKTSSTTTYSEKETNRITRLEGSGTVLGMFPEGIYKQKQLILNPGDTLIIYTDGVTEAQDSQGREFGEKRLADLIRMQFSLSPARLQKQLLTSVQEFVGTGPILDDLTLLLIRAVE